MRLRTIALAAFLLLIGVAGCDILMPPPSADLQPKAQTVDVEDEFGGAVASFSFLVSGDVIIEYGDGAAASMIGGETTRTTLLHTYTKVGTYHVLLRKGVVKYGEATVTVTADLPDVNIPFWTQGIYVASDETIDFQMQYRTPGCNSSTGYPLYENGVKAGDGWTEVRLYAWDSRGHPLGVFDSRAPYGGQAMWGQWVRLPDDVRESYTLTVFAMYDNCAMPPFPLIPRAVQGDSLTAFTAMGCGPVDPWPDPPTPPSPPHVEYEDHMKFRLEARNPYTVDGSEPAIEWMIWVTDGGGCL